MSLKKSLEKLKAAIMMSEPDPDVSGDATTPQERYDRLKKSVEKSCEKKHGSNTPAYNRCMFAWYASKGKTCCRTVGNECQCTVTVEMTYTGGTVVSDSYSYTEPGACELPRNGPRSTPGISGRQCD